MPERWGEQCAELHQKAEDYTRPRKCHYLASLMHRRPVAGHLSISRLGNVLDVIRLLWVYYLDICVTLRSESRSTLWRRAQDSKCTCQRRVLRSRSSLLVRLAYLALDYGRLTLNEGIRAPRTARNASEKSEPYGPESLRFASRYMQRDVEIGELILETGILLMEISFRQH